MLRLGVFSDDLAMDWERSIAVAQEAGVQGLEVRNVWDKSSRDLTDDDVRRMAGALQGSGLRVSCLGSTYGRQFWLDDPEAKRAAEAVLAKMLRCCEILDTDTIRIFVLWIPGYEEDRSKWATRPRFTLDLISRLVDSLRDSARMAERAGVQLVIENEGNSYSGTCREARLLIDALDSPAVAALYHPRPIETTGEPAFPEGYNQVRGLIRHVHVGRLDYVWNGGAPNPPHRLILERLLADGYDGWVTVERHHKARDGRDPGAVPELQQQTLQDIRAVRRILAAIERPNR